MKTYKEMIQARKSLLTQIDSLASHDELTEEQRTEVTGLESQLDELDASIAREETRQTRAQEQADLEARAAAPARRPLVPDVHTGLSHSEHRDLNSFSLGRTLQLLAEGRSIEQLDGVEGEMAFDGRAEAIASGIQVRGKSVMISGKALQSAETRDLTATGGTGGDQGGMTVPTQKLGLLDALFNASVIRDLGATFMTGLTGNIDLPRIIDSADISGKTENAAASEASPTTAMVSFSPKRLPTVVEVSNQLFIQSNEGALESVVRNHLIRKLTALMEAAFINGSGTSEAEGILQTTGIGSVVAGAEALTFADIVNLEKEVAVDNALLGRLSYLTNSKVIAALKQTPKVASTDSRMIMDELSGNAVNGYGCALTNAVPSNLTSGSTSSLSALLFGNFEDYTVGQWSGIEFLVNPYSKDDTGLTRVNASVYYDGHVIRPQSFAAISDVVA